jgi:nitrate/nitrite transporter NarK
MATFLGKLFDQFGPRALVIPSLVIVVVSLWLFTRFYEVTDTHCMALQSIVSHLKGDSQGIINDLLLRKLSH